MSIIIFRYCLNIIYWTCGKSQIYHIFVQGLHGKKSALADFLRRSKHARLRSVCVIHGKGINSRQPAILPSKVRSWLCQSEWVQAFCQANAADGGDGAVHVLLVNERE